MDILHISQVVETAQRDIVFIYHSKEVRDRILNELANAGHRWPSGRATDDKEHAPRYMPGGVRIDRPQVAYYGSLGYYLRQATKFKLVRVVL